jgi:hypothetical protein
VFFEGYTGGNTSYTFSGDLNGDGGTSNDLIYIPWDMSQMNFQAITGSVPFTAAQQAEAWETYIQRDKYLSQHRGEYAVRNAVFLPMVFRADLSVTQDLFRNLGGRHTLQARADIVNIGNMINKNWGLSQRLVNSQPLLVPSSSQGGPADSQGRAQYRLRVVNNQLLTTPLEYSAGAGDVWRVQFTIRYSF